MKANKNICLYCLMLLLITISCNKKGKSVNNTEANPFLNASSLPLQAPAFNKTKNEDFRPALEEGMRQQQAEVAQISADREAPTFENTLVALEKSGQLLNRVNSVFSLLTSANTNPALQKVQQEEAAKLAANQDAIYLNNKLFKRIQAVYQKGAKGKGLCRYRRGAKTGKTWLNA